jgi:hypothetical protein
MRRLVITNQGRDEDQDRDRPACPLPECGGALLFLGALNHRDDPEGFAEEKGAGVRISTWAFVLMLVWLSITGLA